MYKEVLLFADAIAMGVPRASADTPMQPLTACPPGTGQDEEGDDVL